MDGIFALIERATLVDLVVVAAAVVAASTVVAMLARLRGAARRSAADRAEAERLHRWYEAVKASSRDGFVLQSVGGAVLDLNLAACDMLGVEARGAIGRHINDLELVVVDAHGLPMVPAGVFGVRHANGSPGRPHDPVLVGLGRVGLEQTAIRAVQVSTSLVPNGDGDAVAVLSLLRDVTTRQQAKAALERSETQFRVAMENAPIGMALVDLGWRLVEVNAAFAELLGTTVDALRGYELLALSHPDERAAESAEVQRLLDGEKHRFSQEKRYLRADGHEVWAVLDVALARTADGAPDHFVVQVRDSTESRLQAEMLTHRAMHDPLTGLANRTLLQEVLQSVIEQPGASGRLAVMACDLDRFKAVNDRLGHAAGDEVLVHVAGVLRAAAGGRGTVARLGGDEFVVVLHDLDSARTVVEVAAAVHGGLREPLRLQRKRVAVRASIGIAFADADTLANGAPGLLAAADAALYRAKAAGRGRTEVYDPSMAASGVSTSLHAELTDALTNGQLALHYQPIVALSDERVMGHEALIRWKHPQRGMLLPDQFLGVAEEAGIGVSLGTWVVTEAVSYLARCKDQTRWVSINASGDQLGDGEFVARVLWEISRMRVAPGRLVVELTESSLIDSGTRVRHELTQLRAAGVPILLDDFGTGISPLSYLRDLPVNGVKLDRSFTSGIPDDPAAAKVARALGSLARDLTMITIAEGIENVEQGDFLYASGWRYGQGWLFGGGRPESEL
ncbi:MAG: putative bifunctional diguanylate cyclase/phosphodiesterase [Cellulomonas sp.]